MSPFLFPNAAQCDRLMPLTEIAARHRVSPPEVFLTIEEAAHETGVAVQEIELAARRATIPVYRTRRDGPFVRASEVRSMITRGRSGQAAVTGSSGSLKH